jgi:hypothetical protein
MRIMIREATLVENLPFTSKNSISNPTISSVSNILHL